MYKQLAVYAANSRLQFDQTVDIKCFDSWENNDNFVLPWLPCTNSSSNFPKYCGTIFDSVDILKEERIR
jgi:hypothetical protein